MNLILKSTLPCLKLSWNLYSIKLKYFLFKFKAGTTESSTSSTKSTPKDSEVTQTGKCSVKTSKFVD